MCTVRVMVHCVARDYWNARGLWVRGVCVCLWLEKNLTLWNWPQSTLRLMLSLFPAASNSLHPTPPLSLPITYCILIPHYHPHHTHTTACSILPCTHFVVHSVYLLSNLHTRHCVSSPISAAVTPKIISSNGERDVELATFCRGSLSLFLMTGYW